MTSVALRRNIFDADHDVFRSTVRSFALRDVLPHLPLWNEGRLIDRSMFAKAGELGLIGTAVDAVYNGGGIDDFRYNAILVEEICAAGAAAVAMSLMTINDLVIPYLSGLGTPEQKNRWLGPLCRGEKVAAIAMTEPGAGSDLASIRTTAIPVNDSFVVSGNKVFVSNGINADFIIVAVTTGTRSGKAGISLLVVEDGMPGLARTPLHKVGLEAWDMASVTFDEVVVPQDNLLGRVGEGFSYLRRNLAMERLAVAVSSMASMRRTFDMALAYSCDRIAFGQRLADLQTTRFYLAELATEIEVAQCFTDRCIADAADGALDEVTAAMAKWWISDLQQRVVYRSVQMHGGYGYMRDYDVADDLLNSRASPIYAGANEIMKEIIGRRLTRLN